MNCPACDTVLCGCAGQPWPYPTMPARINISSGEDAMIDPPESIDQQVERFVMGYEAAYIFNDE
jgi:hypothetical protein